MDRTARMRERRRDLARQMLGGQCVTCGSTDELHFDHIDPATKLFNIADNWSRRWVEIEQELMKCQLLCMTHHLAKTVVEGSLGTVEHGGGASGKKGCKCDPCRARKREYMKQFMREKRSRSKAP